MKSTDNQPIHLKIEQAFNQMDEDIEKLQIRREKMEQEIRDLLKESSDVINNPKHSTSLGVCERKECGSTDVWMVAGNLICNTCMLQQSNK